MSSISSATRRRSRSLAIQRLCVWSGPAFIVTMAVGFVLVARFIPPPAPGDTASATASLLLDHANRIRAGMIISALAAGLLVPLSTVIALQMHRIEGRFPALAMIQFASGILLSLEFIYLIFFWQAAVFRADRAPELVQLLNDMAWIPYIGLSVTVCMQAASFGIAVLLDDRARPVFPRWFGYYQLWAALFFLPGTFNVFFHDGPLAWDGLVAFYLPIAVYVSWTILTPMFLFTALRHQAEEEALAEASGADLQTLAAEVARLRESLTELQQGPVRT